MNKWLQKNMWTVSYLALISSTRTLEKLRRALVKTNKIHFKSLPGNPTLMKANPKRAPFNKKIYIDNVLQATFPEYIHSSKQFIPPIFAWRAIRMKENNKYRTRCFDWGLEPVSPIPLCTQIQLQFLLPQPGSKFLGCIHTILWS